MRSTLDFSIRSIEALPTAVPLVACGCPHKHASPRKLPAPENAYHCLFAELQPR